jgi:hypothetical protein
MSFFLKFGFVSFFISILLSDHCSASSIDSKYSCKQEFYSQASQDHFVSFVLYNIVDKQDVGYYLEIGANHPIETNNTYFFEKNFGWRGVSIDISDSYWNIWYSTRKNSLLIEDATKSDYQSILKLFPPVIDYLSLDIDNDYDVVLQRIPFNDHVFKIITIEHDFYRFGDQFRKDERRILASLGYYLLCPDVSTDDTVFSFEDWWVHPSAFPSDVFSLITSLDLKAKKHYEIIALLGNLIQSSH